MSRLSLFTLILNAVAPISAFQDPKRITGERYAGDRMDADLKVITLDEAKASRTTSNPYQDHAGIDFAVNTGTKVYAPYDGKIWVGPDSGPQGKYLLLILPGGVEMTLAHLSKIAVVSGQTVKPGELLGLSGATGYTGNGQRIAAHLHVHVARVINRVKHIIDAYPWVFGLVDKSGKLIKPDVKPEPAVDGYKNWANTDEWERTIAPKRYQVKTDGQSLRIRKSPGTDKEAVGSLPDDAVFSIDRWAELPDGQIWGRLHGKPWHWVCIKRGQVFAVEAKEWPAELTDGHYFVRDSWADARSQTGAFRILANAKKLAEFNKQRVFDPDGNEVVYD